LKRDVEFSFAYINRGSYLIATPGIGESSCYRFWSLSRT